MAKSIPAATVKAMLADGNEIALLDVREAGQYADGHPFFAVPLAKGHHLPPRAGAYGVAD